MSAISRLFNILRAKFNFKSDNDLHNSDSFYAEYLRKKQDEANEDINLQSNMNAQYTNYQEPAFEAEGDEDIPTYDPELAQYYNNLEVPYGSDLETVRKAWKHLLRKYHPDMHTNDEEKLKVANELVQLLNDSYQQLAKALKNEKDN